MTEPHDEPPTEAVESVQRTAQLGLLVRLLDSAKNAIFPAIAVFVAFDDLREAIGFLPILGVVLGVIGFFTWLAWWRTTYRVGHDDVRVESGIVSRQARSVPYERIQDVSLEQPLLARIFGLARVKFETGAGGGEDLNLAYVTEVEAARLRDVVRERRDEAEPVTEGDAPSPIEEHETPPLFAMDEKRLLTFGVFEFSLVIFAVILGAIGQLDFLFSWRELADQFFDNVIEGQGRKIAALGMAAQIAGAIAAAGGVIVLGLVTGVVRTFVRDYGFRLDRTLKGFRRRRGLFTKTDVVMPVHRVQAMQYGTRWFRRLFGWHSLKFVSLANDAKDTSHVVVPFGKPEEIAPVADAAGLALPPEDTAWHRPRGAHWVDEALLLALFPLAGIGGVLAFSPIKWPALIIALLFPVIGTSFWLAWRRHKHATALGQLFKRHGILAPQVTTARTMKLQSVEIAQGPLARLRGYCTVHLGLAGGEFSIPGLAIDEARALRADVLEAIAAVDFSELDEQPVHFGTLAGVTV
ncbi:PH domain-containing protein [Pseudoblastomonas halimionae]|uniref:PH domain-containing protein n=1 Tax=Alteriqipengyuania halimionae TaxID=1926630 RepID=A0A6I4U6F1_9SPHN|nr:PH domain-containing protein [Alteriqipengyuania halimionae]MXP10032.1 PH domain-containing protein [Alteriqipengyuania halimionae]